MSSDELKELAHQGDPCVFCGTPHDEVEPGPCPAFKRFGAPLAGEWFLGDRGKLRITQAMFDFAATEFPVLKFCPFMFEPEERRRQSNE